MGQAFLYIIGLLWAAVMELARRTWNRHEKRIDDLEELCARENKQRQHDLTQHAVADAGAHDLIREKLAAELATLHEKIDTKTDALSQQITVQHGAFDTKTDALSQQITVQHGALSAQIFDLAKMIGGKK